MLLQPGASRGEDLLEDPAHRENGRACVDAGGAGRHLAQLAARRGFLLDDQHVEPARGQQNRGDQAANPRTDDHDALDRPAIQQSPRSRLTPASIMVDTPL